MTHVPGVLKMIFAFFFQIDALIMVLPCFILYWLRKLEKNVFLVRTRSALDCIMYFIAFIGKINFEKYNDYCSGFINFLWINFYYYVSCPLSLGPDKKGCNMYVDYHANPATSSWFVDAFGLRILSKIE